MYTSTLYISYDFKRILMSLNILKIEKFFLNSLGYPQNIYLVVRLMTQSCPVILQLSKKNIIKEVSKVYVVFDNSHI